MSAILDSLANNFDPVCLCLSFPIIRLMDGEAINDKKYTQAVYKILIEAWNERSKYGLNSIYILKVAMDGLVTLIDLVEDEGGLEN